MQTGGGVHVMKKVPKVYSFSVIVMGRGEYRWVCTCSYLMVVLMAMRMSMLCTEREHMEQSTVHVY